MNHLILTVQDPWVVILLSLRTIVGINPTDANFTTHIVIQIKMSFPS